MFHKKILDDYNYQKGQINLWGRFLLEWYKNETEGTDDAFRKVSFASRKE